MNVQVLVSQLPKSPELEPWVSRRLHEVLGAAVSHVVSIAVVLSPAMTQAGKEPQLRCSMVVTTVGGRRVVETRDASADAALERAMRLVSLSLFGETPRTASVDVGEKPAPLT